MAQAQTLQNRPQSTDLNEEHQKAEVNALALVGQIVNAALQQIQVNQFFKRNLLPYSNEKAMISLNEVNNLFFKMETLAKKVHKQEQQPKPLLIDSLLPSSADIDPENQYKKNLGKPNLLEESSVRFKLREKQSTIDNKQKYKKLQITEGSQEDGFTKQMRKIENEKKEKQQSERKLSQKKQKIRLQKLKDKKKEEKFSYGYNGEVLELKLENKANLVSKLVNGGINQKLKIVKQAINDPNPTLLQGINPNKKANKKFQQLTNTSATKRRDEVQFSDVKSLADNFNTTNGVKYTYEGKTFEVKKRVVSTIQLKKSLSQRKMSKEQYIKLRQLNNNREDLQQNLKKSVLKSSQSKSQRVHSEMKFKAYSQKKAKQTIHVSNSNLKEKMMQKIVQFQQPQTQQPQRTQDSQFRIGSIDSYNMEYMKTGGSLPMSTSKEFFGQKKNDNQLPKIMHTTLYSNTKPKGRQKIKEANQILRQMRKKFEEKLRI